MTPGQKRANSPVLSCEEMLEGLEFYFSRRFGISSEAMFTEAMGLRVRGRWIEGRPWDAGDSAGVEETYELAPEWLKERMLPRLTWYREIARLGWPDESPPRVKETAHS